MPIRNIHHLGIATRDMDEALRFWQGAVGLPVVKDGEEAGLRLALLRIGNSFIELLQPLDATSETAAFIERTGGGLDHLCFETDTLHEDHAAIVERGLPLLYGGKPERVFTGEAFFVAPGATQGITVEFLAPDEPAVPGRRETALFTEMLIATTITGDLFGTARQWEQNFGLQVESYLDAPEGDNRHVMIPTGAKGAVYIEPLMPQSPEGKNQAYLDKAGDGLFQIGVRADDPTEAARRLNEAGYRAMQTEGMDQGRLATFVHPKSTGNVFLAVFPLGPIPSGPVPW